MYEYHQNLILDILLQRGETTGRKLRELLNTRLSWWRRWSGAGFYNLIAKMEDAGKIVRRIEVIENDGEVYHIRHYTKK